MKTPKALLILSLVLPGLLCLGSLASAKPIPRTGSQSGSRSGSRSGDAKILARLRRRVRVNIQGVPLKKAIDDLLAPARVDVYISHTALTGVGINASIPVTLRLPHPVTIAAALRLLLKRASPGISYAVFRGVVMITTRSQCGKMVVTGVYSLDAILGRAKASRHSPKYHRITWNLMQTIQKAFDRNSWTDNGGLSASMHVAFGALIVTATPRVQVHVTNFLEKMELLRLQQKRRRSYRPQRP